MKRRLVYDVLIVGGGPAGLSAALVLGRACRRVLLVDSGEGRNRASLRLHSYLTRDGVSPARFLELGRRNLDRYSVEIRKFKLSSIRCCTAIKIPGQPKRRTRFEATFGPGRRAAARKLLLATGVRDELPDIPGFKEWLGRGVYHCPYCDAWERRDRHLVAYGRGEPALGLGLALRTWSAEVTVCTDGEGLSAKNQAKLTPNGLSWRGEKIHGLEGNRGRLRSVHFKEGEPISCAALFFNTDQVQRSALPWSLGCKKTREGGVKTDKHCFTGVPGLYLAGDALCEVQFAITAAADGARAAVAINRELQDEDRMPE